MRFKIILSLVKLGVWALILISIILKFSVLDRYANNKMIWSRRVLQCYPQGMNKMNLKTKNSIKPITVGGGGLYPPLWFVLNNLKMAYIRKLKLLQFLQHYKCEHILLKKTFFWCIVMVYNFLKKNFDIIFKLFKNPPLHPSKLKV